MSRVLGPPGVGIVVGARVDFLGRGYLVVHLDEMAGAMLLPHGGSDRMRYAVPPDTIRLDLTDGPLFSGASCAP